MNIGISLVFLLGIVLLVQTKENIVKTLTPEQQEFLVPDSVLRHYGFDAKDFELEDRAELAKYFEGYSVNSLNK